MKYFIAISGDSFFIHDSFTRCDFGHAGLHGWILMANFPPLQTYSSKPYEKQNNTAEIISSCIDSCPPFSLQFTLVVYHCCTISSWFASNTHGGVLIFWQIFVWFSPAVPSLWAGSGLTAPFSCGGSKYLADRRRWQCPACSAGNP